MTAQQPVGPGCVSEEYIVTLMGDAQTGDMPEKFKHYTTSAGLWVAAMGDFNCAIRYGGKDVVLVARVKCERRRELSANELEAGLAYEPKFRIAPDGIAIVAWHGPIDFKYHHEVMKAIRPVIIQGIEEYLSL